MAIRSRRRRRRGTLTRIDFANHSSRATHGQRIVGNGLGNNTSCADDAITSQVRHNYAIGPDPAVGANCDVSELLLAFLNGSSRIAERVLPAATENLDMIS